MQRQGETYGEWEARTFCDNASRRGTGISLRPQCCNGKREFECTVIYNEGVYGRDTFIVCRDCRDNMKKEARRHGYRFKSKPCKTDGS